MMFEIDFLKEQGLPQKHRPLEIGLYTAGVVFLVVIMSVLYIQYYCNKADLKAKQDQLTRLEEQVKKSPAQGVKTNLEKCLKDYDQCYLEIAGAIGRYVQWTPILREIADSLPPSMLLTELSVIRTVEKKNVTSILDPTKKVDYEIINRTIKSNVYDFIAGSESIAIGEYLESLRASQLKGSLKEAYIVESSDEEYKDPSGKTSKVKNYVINCLLKPQEVVEAK